MAVPSFVGMTNRLIQFQNKLVNSVLKQTG